MILQKNKVGKTFGGKSYAMTIDVQDLQKVKQSISKIYSNPFAWIREITTNAIDTHKETGTDLFVEIDLDLDDNGRFIYIRDFGTGISPEFMENTFIKIGKSTRNSSNDYIGGYGFGRTSLLAYTDLCYYITNVDGKKYTYTFTSVNGGSFDLVHTEDTSEINGTTVKVYLKDQTYRGVDVAETQIRFNTAYLSGIKSSLFSQPIYKSDLFWYTPEFEGDKHLHIIIEGCYFKLPFEELGIERLEVPVGLYFKNGELSFTPNREQLELNSNTILKIKDKYTQFTEHLLSLSEKSYTTLGGYLNNKNNFNIQLLPNLSVFIPSLKSCIYYEPLKEVQKLTGIKDLFITKYISYINKTKLVLLHEDEIEAKLSYHYVKELYVVDVNYLQEVYFRGYMDGKYCISNQKLSLTNYKYFFKLDKVPKDKWRFIIETYNNWFKSQFTLMNFSEVKQTESFKNYVKSEKDNRVYDKTGKKKELTLVAEWTKIGDRRVTFKKVQDFNESEFITVTKDTSMNTVNWLFSLLQNKLTMIKGKKEDYEYIYQNSIVADVYYANELLILFNVNHNLFKHLYLREVECKLIEKTKQFINDYKNKLAATILYKDFYEELKDLIDKNNLTSSIQSDYNKLIEMVKQYQFLNWIDNNSIANNKKLIDYILELRKVKV